MRNDRRTTDAYDALHPADPARIRATLSRLFADSPDASKLIDLAMSAIERTQAGKAHSEPSLGTTRSILAATKELSGSDPRSERHQEIQHFLQHMNWQSDQAAQMIRKYPWLTHLLERKEKPAPQPEFAVERKGKQGQQLRNEHNGMRKEPSSEAERTSHSRGRAYGELKPRPHRRHNVPSSAAEPTEVIALVETRAADLDRVHPRVNRRATFPTP